jgi:uncharacterized coiled-coil protein SlyX
MNKTTNETVQSMQHLDSLKAVKVAMDMNKAQDKTIEKLIDLVASMDKNMKLLATKVLELEQKLNNAEKALDLYEIDLTKLDKKVEGLEAYANREI